MDWIGSNKTATLYQTARIANPQCQPNPAKAAHKTTTTQGGSFQNASKRKAKAASAKSGAERMPLVQTG